MSFDFSWMIFMIEGKENEIKQCKQYKDMTRLALSFIHKLLMHENNFLDENALQKILWWENRFIYS